MGNVTDYVRTALFVYMFKNSQCILSYGSLSLGTGNINELWFYLEQEYKKTKKLRVRFLQSLSIFLLQIGGLGWPFKMRQVWWILYV